jgi:hypothetical protein
MIPDLPRTQLANAWSSYKNSLLLPGLPRMTACYCLVIAEQQLDSAGFSHTNYLLLPGPLKTTAFYYLVLQSQQLVTAWSPE